MSQSIDTRRYAALDGLRAMAMLLGVLYHAILFGGMGAGMFGPGRGGGSGMWLGEWLHSFRMPLFFLISGFFCAMMLAKYGTWRYLTRRWARIGFPLVLGLFTVVPLYLSTRTMAGPGGGMGGGPMLGPPGARGMGAPGMMGPGGPVPDVDDLPPPPPGFVPPPLVEFDADENGTLDDKEWAKVLAEMPPPGPFGGPSGGMRGGGPMPFGGPGGGVGPPMGGGPFGGGNNPLGARVFGTWSSLFQLEFLWFLWYLLVFATFAPLLVAGIGWVVGQLSPSEEWTRRMGAGVLRYGLAPIVLGLVSTPLLMMTRSFSGWSLGLASGIFRGVPDFLFHLEPDMLFYLAYFLAGWAVYRLRDGLPDVARWGLPSLVMGIAAYVGATYLSARYANRRDLPNYETLRLLGYTTASLGAALTSFGWLGLFQRHLDRPSRAGRYLAETAFWIYMVHEPVMMPVLRAVGSNGCPWWIQAPLVAIVTSAIAIVLYELVVRPTWLARLFGPSSRARPRLPAVELPGSRRTPTSVAGEASAVVAASP